MYCSDIMLNIGAITMEAEVCFTRSPFIQATRLDPPEGGELEITGVWVKWICGVDYDKERALFQSWAPILDDMAWEVIENDTDIRAELHAYADCE